MNAIVAEQSWIDSSSWRWTCGSRPSQEVPCRGEKHRPATTDIQTYLCMYVCMYITNLYANLYLYIFEYSFFIIIKFDASKIIIEIE